MEILLENNDQSLFIDVLSDIICQYLDAEQVEISDPIVDKNIDFEVSRAA